MLSIKLIYSLLVFCYALLISAKNSQGESRGDKFGDPCPKL